MQTLARISRYLALLFCLALPSIAEAACPAGNTGPCEPVSTITYNYPDISTLTDGARFGLATASGTGRYTTGLEIFGYLQGKAYWLPLAGGTLTGELITKASASGSSGLNLPQGAAPTSPANGDVWTTSAGIYVQIAGGTVGPLGTGGGGGGTPANPTATAGPAAVNGSATTYMRSDAAPAVQKGSSSLFGLMECDNTTVTCPGGVLTSVGGGSVSVTAADPTIVINPTPGTSTFTVGTQTLVDATTCVAPAGNACTIPSGDMGETVIVSNSSAATAITLPQAGTTGFEAGKSLSIINVGVFPAIVTPTTSTIGGAASVTLAGGSGNVQTCPLSSSGNYVESCASGTTGQDSITAHAGGGQASATALHAVVSNVTTVATTADSVKLDPSFPGDVQIVTDSSANAMQVFGTGSDTINAAASGTGVSQAAGVTTMYVSPVAGKFLATALTTGGGGSGTVTSVATTGPITGGTITATGTIACATCVTASSPGVGVAHFAGSTQAVTSSTVATGDIAAAAVTYAKVQNGASNGLLGVNNGAAPSEVAIGSGLSLAGGTLTSSATSTIANGQAQLQYVSATQIILTPMSGSGIQINDVVYNIPANGFTCANTGVYVGGTAAQNLAASTLYYVYAYRPSTTLLCDFWTGANAGHGADITAGNVGVEVRNNAGTPDSTRTLIGMVYTNGSSQFVSTAAAQQVRSWFMPGRLPLIGAALSATTSAATSFAELGSGKRVTFLSWAGETANALFAGYANNSIAVAATLSSGLGANSTSVDSSTGAQFSETVASANNNYAAAYTSASLTEGLNYLAPLGYVTGTSASGTWNGAITGSLGGGFPPVAQNVFTGCDSGTLDFSKACNSALIGAVQ